MGRIHYIDPNPPLNETILLIHQGQMLPSTLSFDARTGRWLSRSEGTMPYTGHSRSGLVRFVSVSGMRR